MIRSVPRSACLALIGVGLLALAPQAVAHSTTVMGSTDDARLQDLAPTVDAALGLRKSTVFELPIDPTPGKGVFAVVPSERGPLLLNLEPHSVRSPDYKLFVQNDDGSLSSIHPGVERTLRGEALGHPGSLVAASLLEDGLHARIMLADGSDLWIQPVAAQLEGAMPFDYVLYDGADVLEGPGTCATDAQLQVELASVPQAGDADPTAGGGIQCAQIAFDTDYQFFQARGSVSSVQNWITSVLNSVNLQYENDVQITHEMTGLIVRSSSNDPYNNSPNSSSLLNQFQGEWQSNPPPGVTYDLAELFTGRNLSGSTIGVAWVGAVCTNFRYSLVQSLFNGNDPSPDSCATDLSAHEMGHNWGAGHCSCTNFTMNSFITCANQFSSASISSITAHRNSRTCINDCGGGGPTCGDGNCDPGEDSCNCPEDCGPPPAEICDDGVDNDCDGLTDCDDPDCSADPSCQGGGDDAVVDCVTYVTRGGPQQNKHLDVTVTVVDGGNASVANASVSMTLTLSGGGSWNFAGTTGSAGEVSFTLNNASDGCYTSDVTALSGVAGNPAEPANGFQKGFDSFPDADCRSGADGCGSG